VASRKIKPVDEIIIHQPRHEILQVADLVAREKNIERDEVLNAMEHAILKAAKAKYGADNDIRVIIDKQTGDTRIYNVQRVVDVIENDCTDILLADARLKDPQAQVGDEIEEELPPVEYGRVAAQSARQIIVQKVRDAERARQYEEFKDRVGEITSGVVKRIEFGNVVLDLGRGEAVLRRDDIIPRENFRAGDRIRVLITELRPDARGPMISVSRTHPHFMAKLFEQEVPEIYEGIIEIRSVARDPGSRAKIAVYTSDSSIDPVGACVGMRGARVQSVVNELQGEKVDIILWSPNLATFMVNALAPAEIIRVVIDEEAQKVDVVVEEDQLSLAIGRRGQNVRLASMLTGCNIDIVTEADDVARRTEENATRCALFMEALDVDDMIAQLLSSEGFASIEDIAYIDADEFASIEGFDTDIAQELQNRAQDYLENRNALLLEKCRTNGMEAELLAIEGLDGVAFDQLLRKNIKTRDDLAELSGEELLDIIGKERYTKESADAIIMAARAHWFA
jgi:N utilization substance protein A